MSPRTMRPLPLILLLAALSLLGACGPSGGSPSGCEDGFYEGAPTESLVLGETLSGVFAELSEGGDIHFVWGFQGGTMILPSVQVAPEVAGAHCCAFLELDNLTDPAFPDDAGELDLFPGFRREVTLYEVDGTLRTLPFENQIGWGSPNGVRMILRATLRGPDYAASASLPLRVVDEGGFDLCDELPTTGGGGGGCDYRLIAGTGTVTALEDQSGASCADPVTVAYRFSPTDAAHAECYTDTGFPIAYGSSQFLSRACVEEAGIGVGSTFGVTWQQILGGTCTPAILVEDVDLSACAEACR